VLVDRFRRFGAGLEPAVRRARVAAAAVFCITGLVSASWFGRIPAVQERLDLSAGGLAIAILGVEGGALAGLSLGGAVVVRWGSRRAVQGGVIVFAPGVLVAAVAPSLAWLTIGLALWAVANSVLDVALNAQGVGLEREADRPLLSGLHAVQGFGLLSGAVVATAAAAAGVSLVAHLTVVAATALTVGLAASLGLAREPNHRRESAGRRPGYRPSAQLLLVGVIAFCAFLMDGVATNWVGVHLGDDHGAGQGLAAAGFTAFAAALVTGRLFADRLLSCFSRARLVQACGLLAVGGTAIAVLAPSAVVALVGWAVLGLGVAPLAPILLGAAPDARPSRHPAGQSRDDPAAAMPAPAAIAIVTSVGYLGSFLGPPLVGAVAEIVNLAVALTLIALAGLTAILLARWLPERRTSDTSVARTH
jgi:hypothetical protein